MKQILTDFMDWVIDEEGMTTNEKRTPPELFVNDYLASEKGKQALSLFGVTPSTLYDCDDCKYFPCHSNQDNYGSKNKPIERGLCGDHALKHS